MSTLCNCHGVIFLDCPNRPAPAFDEWFERNCGIILGAAMTMRGAADGFGGRRMSGQTCMQCKHLNNEKRLTCYMCGELLAAPAPVIAEPGADAKLIQAQTIMRFRKMLDRIGIHGYYNAMQREFGDDAAAARPAAGSASQATDLVTWLDDNLANEEGAGFERRAELIESTLLEAAARASSGTPPARNAPTEVSDISREKFEQWVLRTRKQTQPFGLVERTATGYLDLYTQKQWEGWQAATESIEDAVGIAVERLNAAATAVTSAPADAEEQGTCEHDGPVGRIPHLKMDTCVNWTPIPRRAAAVPADEKNALGELSLMAQGWKRTEIGAFYTIYDCAESLEKWIATARAALALREVPDASH